MIRSGSNGAGGELPASLPRPVHHGASVQVGPAHAVGFSELGSAVVLKLAEGAPDVPGQAIMQAAAARREQLLTEVTVITLWLRQVESDQRGAVVSRLAL